MGANLTHITCGWGFLKKYSLELHQLVHTPYNSQLGVYTCPVKDCGHLVKLREKLISHYNLKHGTKQKPYQCGECSAKFTQLVWYKTHLRLHQEGNSSGKKFLCEECGVQCEDSIALNGHRRGHGKKVPRSTQNEDGALPLTRKRGRPKGPKTEEELGKSQKEKRKWAHVPCTVCGATCDSRVKLRRHLELEHEQDLTEEDRNIQCHFCHRRFKHEQTIKLHLIGMHNKQVHKFICDAEECEMHFENCELLNQHIKQVHLEIATSLIKCQVCGWLFATQDYYDLHLLNHVAPLEHKKYPCNFCHLHFESVTKLKHHWNTEHGKNLKPYRCAECPARFFLPVRLLSHQQLHNRRKKLVEGTKPVCIDCNKQFPDFILLKKHRKVHNPENHIRCTEPGCEQLLQDRKTLSYHLKKVHGQGERYPCPECGQCYIYEWQVRKHMLWSHGPPKYECDICGQKYRRPNALTRHKKTHNSDPESYICSECGKGYNTAEGLKYHVASKHMPNELKRFSCPHCPYKSDRRMLYKMHLVACLRSKGIPYDEQKYGEMPKSMKGGGGPKKKPGRKVGWNKKREDDQEEEMEEKSTTEEEDNEEDQKEFSTINCILANLTTGTPDIAGREEKKKSRGRPSKVAPELSSVTTVDHNVASVSTSQQVTSSYQNYSHDWLGNSSNPSLSSGFPLYQQYSQQQQQMGNEVKPGGGYGDTASNT